MCSLKTLSDLITHSPKLPYQNTHMIFRKYIYLTLKLCMEKCKSETKVRVVKTFAEMYCMCMWLLDKWKLVLFFYVMFSGHHLRHWWSRHQGWRCDGWDAPRQVWSCCCCRLLPGEWWPRHLNNKSTRRQRNLVVWNQHDLDVESWVFKIQQQFFWHSGFFMFSVHLT